LLGLLAALLAKRSLGQHLLETKGFISFWRGKKNEKSTFCIDPISFDVGKSYNYSVCGCYDHCYADNGAWATQDL